MQVVADSLLFFDIDDGGRGGGRGAQLRVSGEGEDEGRRWTRRRRDDGGGDGEGGSAAASHPPTLRRLR